MTNQGLHYLKKTLEIIVRITRNMELGLKKTSPKWEACRIGHDVYLGVVGE